MNTYTGMFQALAEPTRLRIVALLAHAQKELCVCELVDSLEEPQYHVSRSLARLREAGLVMERPEGKWVYYRLADHESDFRGLLLKAVRAIPEKALQKDRRELAKRLKLREGGKCLTGPRKTHLLSRRA